MNVIKKPLIVPRNRNGSVIITSRSRAVALRMVHYRDLLEVKAMERSEAMEVFERQLGQSRESQDSHRLVEALEFMPLAIAQAASFLRERGPRYSVSKYLRDFQENKRKATRLMEAEVVNLYRDSEAKNSILVTWQISFDYLRQTKQSAADLLSMMSFFRSARDTREPYPAST